MRSHPRARHRRCASRARAAAPRVESAPLEATGRTSRIDLPLLGIVALALGLRVQGIADDGFWLDEMTSLRDAGRPFGKILAGKGGPSHPPLFYLLLKPWIMLFGKSEIAVRMLSALLGTATVAAAFALFRALHGRAVGLAAALFLAVSFHHIVFSQEARMYALFCLLAVLSALTLWQALEQGGRGRWARAVACTVLMIYTHHLAAAVLLAEGAAVLLAAATGRMRKGALKAFAIAAPCVVVASVPSAVLYVFGGMKGGHAELTYRFWQPYWSARGLGDIAFLWVPGTPLLSPKAFLWGPNPPQVPWLPWLTAALALPLLFLVLAKLRGQRAPLPSPGPPPLLFHGALLYGGIVAFAGIALVKPIWHIRYVFVLLPFYLGGLAVLLLAFRTTRARVAAAAVVVALSLPGLVKEKRMQGRTQWRDAAAALAANGNEPVYLLGSGSARAALGFYYKGRIEHFRDRERFVAAVRDAAARGGKVLAINCGAHGPPDPANLASGELMRTLRMLTVTFGPLRVFEFEKAP